MPAPAGRGAERKLAKGRATMAGACQSDSAGIQPTLVKVTTTVKTVCSSRATPASPILLSTQLQPACSLCTQTQLPAAPAVAGRGTARPQTAGPACWAEAAAAAPPGQRQQGTAPPGCAAATQPLAGPGSIRCPQELQPGRQAIPGAPTLLCLQVRLRLPLPRARLLGRGLLQTRGCHLLVHSVPWRVQTPLPRHSARAASLAAGSAVSDQSLHLAQRSLPPPAFPLAELQGWLGHYSAAPQLRSPGGSLCHVPQKCCQAPPAMSLQLLGLCDCPSHRLQGVMHCLLRCCSPHLAAQIPGDPWKQGAEASSRPLPLPLICFHHAPAARLAAGKRTAAGLAPPTAAANRFPTTLGQAHAAPATAPPPGPRCPASHPLQSTPPRSRPTVAIQGCRKVPGRDQGVTETLGCQVNHIFCSASAARQDQTAKPHHWQCNCPASPLPQLPTASLRYTRCQTASPARRAASVTQCAAAADATGLLLAPSSRPRPAMLSSWRSRLGRRCRKRWRHGGMRVNRLQAAGPTPL